MSDVFQKITDFLYEEKTAELNKGQDGRDMVIGFMRDKTGGALTFLRDRAEPDRGYPSGEHIQMACAVKKTIAFTIQLWRKSNIIDKAIILLSAKIWINLIIDLFYFTTKDFHLPFEKLSQPVKEVWRWIKWEKLRDLICFVLEFDTAYRFRFQDIMAELQRWAMKEQPLRELNRLFNILIERENYADNMKPKWRFIKYAVLTYLLLHRRTLKELQTFLANINTEEIAFSREDIYWTSQFYNDYNFRGKNLTERTAEMLKLYGKSQVEKDEKLFKEGIYHR